MARNLTCLRSSMLYTEAAFLNYKILQYTYLCVAIVTLVTNLCIMVLFVKLRYFKTRHHQFLMTLTITDFLASCTAEPIISYDFMLLSRGHNDCNISSATRMLGSTLCFMSISTIFLINGEQYIKIVRPYRALQFPPWALFTGLAFVWAFFIVIAAVSIYIYPGVLFTKFKIGFSLMVVIIFIFLCYTQVRINIEISRIAVKDVVVGGGGGKGGSIYSPPSNTNANNNRAEQNRLLIRTSRMARSILLLFGLCFAPLVIVSFAQFFIRHTSKSKMCSTFYRTWCYLALYLNSLLDPLVYCIRLKSVRRTLLSGLKKRSDAVVNMTTIVVRNVSSSNSNGQVGPSTA